MGSRKQKGVFVYEVGMPVRLGEREVPSPKQGEVLVKVTSTQLLPHDSYGRDLGYFIGAKLPFVLGSSVAGVVEKLGPDATSSIKVGDRVFGISNLACPVPDQAGLQEYAVLQTDSIAHTPSSSSDDQVATLPINMATNMIGLFTKGFGLGFPAPWDGEAFQSFDFASRTLVILGAGASIAKLLVRIASKVLGIKNVIAIASLSNRDDLTQAGASHVVDRHDPDDKIIQQVLSAAGGHGNISQIIDCASWEHHLATALLTPDKPSRLVTYHAVDQAKVREQRPQCEATAVRCSNANMGSNAEAFWKELPRWLEAGLIQPTAFKTLDGLENVDEINKQLDEYAAGKGYPQLVVHP